ncbi:MAG: hypothetical protein CL833_04975 [Crocinitomicaceae bacterium]|nr:hypothetical protein [Crocinitomicaceae bacterium]|tara:strand:+ start:2308 stop:2664 length:357 start_codon:yes stop_codon:yes gene_type:complete
MRTNEVRLVGNVVSEPKVFDTEKDFAVVRVAVNSKVGDREDTLYIDVKMFGRAFGDLKYYDIQKGDRVQVDGRLITEDFTTSKGEEVKNRPAIIANSVSKFFKKVKPEAAETAETAGF